MSDYSAVQADGHHFGLAGATFFEKEIEGVFEMGKVAGGVGETLCRQNEFGVVI
jgi:hypothetical protein